MNRYAAWSYLDYFLKAKHKKAHGIHSPFLFKLIVEVFNDDVQEPSFSSIERYRKQLKKNKTPIHQAVGAGTKGNRKQTIASIASVGLTKSHYTRLLYRLGRYFKVHSVLELGTSLGVTSMYLASLPHSEITTVEAHPLIAEVARNAFVKYRFSNIRLQEMYFDDYLETLTDEVFDLVFIDGNHLKEPTINYFETLLKHAYNETVFVFDDIHWSEGMAEAWKYIIQHPKTTLTIDIFQFGLVFLKKELSKQHFIIRY